MPTLKMIDLHKGSPDHINEFEVTNRDGAYRILKADFQNTADPEWAADILSAFNAGENDITRPNGEHDSFRVEYSE